MQKKFITTLGLLGAISMPIFFGVACGSSSGSRGHDDNNDRDHKDYNHYPLFYDVYSTKNGSQLATDIGAKKLQDAVTAAELGFSVPILNRGDSTVFAISKVYDQDTHEVTITATITPRQDSIYQGRDQGKPFSINFVIKGRDLLDSEITGSNVFGINSNSITKLKTIVDLKHAYITKGDFQGGIAYLTTTQKIFDTADLYFVEENGVRKLTDAVPTSTQTIINGTYVNDQGATVSQEVVVLVSLGGGKALASEFNGPGKYLDSPADTIREDNFFGIPTKYFIDQNRPPCRYSSFDDKSKSF